MLLAAGRLISEGQWRQGSAILAQTADLTPEQMSEKNLLLAKIDLIRDQPKSALNRLAKINETEMLSVYHQIQYHELFAQAHRSAGNKLEAINERITLETLLTDKKSQSNNRRNLWLTQQ